MSELREAARAGSLGELIKSSRRRKALTLKDLAADPEVGVSPTFLSRIERSEALPSDDLLLKIARRLEMDAPAALMVLFRERASPAARELLPVPSVLKLNESTQAPVRSFEGLEAIAGPLSQVLDLYRNAISENAHAREEMERMGQELAARESELAARRRDSLPAVNEFLMSLFHYESDMVRRDAVVSRAGDATVTVTLEGVRPRRDAKPIHSIVHTVYLPQAVDGSLSIAEGHPPEFEIIEKPDDLRVDCSFRRTGPERGDFHVLFPDEYRWTPGARNLSYRFRYRLERAFVMTLEEAMATYGRRTRHETPLEWSSCYINKPVRRLEISVTFPEGYTPSYIDKWVWWTESSFLACDYNLADKLLADPQDGIEFEEGERTMVRLRATNPLMGFSYGIVWQPLAKRQFLSMING